MAKATALAESLRTRRNAERSSRERKRAIGLVGGVALVLLGLLIRADDKFLSNDLGTTNMVL